MALYSEGWHWISIFMILWNRKQHSNIVRLLLVYTPNLFDWHSNIWDLIDPLERHANSYKRKEATGRYKKALACIRIPLNDHTNPQNNDWYQIAKCITYVNATFICCPIWCLCDVMWNHQTSFEVGFMMPHSWNFHYHTYVRCQLWFMLDILTSHYLLIWNRF